MKKQIFKILNTVVVKFFDHGRTNSIELGQADATIGLLGFAWNGLTSLDLDHAFHLVNLAFNFFQMICILHIELEYQ